jgi:hypothetical protein
VDKNVYQYTVQRRSVLRTGLLRAFEVAVDGMVTLLTERLSKTGNTIEMTGRSLVRTSK